jgi:MFS family permease
LIRTTAQTVEPVPTTQPAPPTRVRAAAATTFAALANRNFRRFYAGQAVSMIGTWMESVAQSWLVLTLTNSGFALGLVVALQTLPVLLGAPYAGVIADRVDKRKLLLGTQTVMGSLSVILGTLVVTHTVQLWMVFVLAFCLGCANAVDNPTRQSFVLEMVGPEHLRNAVTLNSVMVNAARAVGPAVAGTLIAVVGVGICFLINAGSFAAVLFALATMNVSALRRSPVAPRAKGQLREGLSYVRHTPELWIPLVMMGLVGMLAYEFQVVLPIVARESYHGGAQAYGFLTAAMGVGAVIGGLVVAARGATGIKPLIAAATGFGGVILLAAASPNLYVACAAMLLVGAGSVSFLAVGNATLQLGADPAMRGRVMALWAVAFLGSTPIGGPVAGYVSEHLGGRAGLVLGGIACWVAAAGAYLVLRRITARRASAPVEDEVAAADAVAA